jgi:hypothetical protein
VWPVTLSGRLPVVALVGHYPTNKLIGRGPIPSRKTFHHQTMRPAVISGISPNFLELSQSRGQVAHVLLTRSPLEHPPEGRASFDLHVLSTPPAFVLSQDQTLRRCLNQAENRELTHSRSNNPKKSQTTNIRRHPRHGAKLGTDFRHAVEFSRSGRTTSRPSRVLPLACCPTCAGFRSFPRRDHRSGDPFGPRGAKKTLHHPRTPSQGARTVRSSVCPSLHEVTSGATADWLRDFPGAVPADRAGPPELASR